jgi:hypothetical protein
LERKDPVKTGEALLDTSELNFEMIPADSYTIPKLKGGCVYLSRTECIHFDEELETVPGTRSGYLVPDGLLDLCVTQVVLEQTGSRIDGNSGGYTLNLAYPSSS